jgi:putative transposase
MTLRTYKYRLYPRPAQQKNLFRILDVARSWYNMCVEERKWAYELERRNVSRLDQQHNIRHYKSTFPQAKQVHTHVLLVVTHDVQKAFDGFFRRLKAGDKAGFPRFKTHKRYNSFGLAEHGNGFRLVGHRLKIFGVGRIPVRMHRPIPEDAVIKTVRVIHRAGQWFAAFVCEVADVSELSKTGRYIGLDMGVYALVTTSEGEKIENPKYYRKAQSKLRRIQRSFCRKKNGSQNRRKVLHILQRHHLHVVNQRSDYLHKLSTALVRSYDGIALEDLNIAGLSRNSHLSKSILDSGWAMLKQFLTYKAESAGREIRLVNPSYTSQTCPQCGKVEKIDLSARWVDCQCGLSLDRDHRAALNILIKAGWDVPVTVNVGSSLHGLETTPL